MGLGPHSTIHHALSAYLLEAQRYLPDSASRLALLAFINIPVIAIVLNVLRQLVRPRTSSLALCC
jgi:sterol 14alpha-demethylase